MSGPRYDLVPPVGGTTPPPEPKPAQPHPVSHDPDLWRWDKVLYALAIALITGWLVAMSLAST